MKRFEFHRRKNDFCFAFVIAAMFAVTIVGAVAGYRDIARGAAGVQAAKAQAAPVAHRETGKQEQVAHAGARW